MVKTLWSPDVEGDRSNLKASRSILWSAWSSLLILAILAMSGAGCEKKKRPPPPPREEEPVPKTPKVDEMFLTRAFGPGLSLANAPLIADLDHRGGLEALVATHRGRKDYQVAVVRGNHQVLAAVPLGGKILAHAYIQATGVFKVMDLFKDGSKTYMMPVETLVYQRSVCGLLAFRYRKNVLSLVGEFSCKCWRRKAGGDGSDPYSYIKISRDKGELRVTTQEREGPRVYRWDRARQEFLRLARLPGK